jgi:hypothetical protein
MDEAGRVGDESELVKTFKGARDASVAVVRIQTLGSAYATVNLKGTNE